MAYVNLGQVMYPVGAIYQSWSSVSPASLFGGSWSQITEKFYTALIVQATLVVLPLLL